MEIMEVLWKIFNITTSVTNYGVQAFLPYGFWVADKIDKIKLIGQSVL